MADVANALVGLTFAGFGFLVWVGLFVAAVVKASRPGSSSLLSMLSSRAAGTAAGAPKKFEWGSVIAGLSHDVHGQELAVGMMVEQLRARFALGVRKGPATSLLFLGPAGVGKTEMARRLALRLGRHSLELDMGTLQQQPDAAIAAHLRAHPRSVVLFDRMEKVDPRFVSHLLWILDGEALGAGEQRSDIRGSIAIFSTSAASDGLPGILEKHRGAPETLDAALRRLIENADRFPKELLNRIDRVIPFAPLGVEAMLAVVDDAVKLTADAVSVDVGEVPPAVLKHLYKLGGGLEVGVPAMRGAVERALATELARHKRARVRLQLEGESLRVERVD